VRVRTLTAEELGVVSDCMRARPFEKHRERLEQQSRGDILYLVAWEDDGGAVGHELLRWRGRLGFPQVEDLFVLPARRAEGIGSLLLDAAERQTRRRGFVRIGLGVAVENDGARRLYERRGYAPAEEEPYLVTYPAYGDDGIQRVVNELTLFLVKELP
jgi:GNAT superfamily N-acetyltransferase